MLTKIHWIITDENITVNYNGQTHIVSRSGSLADKLINAIKLNKLDEVPELVSATNRIEKFGNGKFFVKDGKIYINNIETPIILGNKILQFAEEKLPYEPLIKFAENIQNNPSFRAVNELFLFLEKNNHPITDTGCFIAYKKVSSNFLDLYSNTIDNSVGKIVEMPRNQVNEDPTITCSNGLHVANWSYAKDFYNLTEGTIMLEVEVNPADVVAVPIDYDSAKMRVCRYKVLGVVDCENSSSLVTTSDDKIEWVYGPESESNTESGCESNCCSQCSGCSCKDDDEYDDYDDYDEDEDDEDEDEDEDDEDDEEHYEYNDDDDDYDEKLKILNALDKANGNQTKAAKFLGLARSTLYDKLIRYGFKKKL